MSNVERFQLGTGIGNVPRRFGCGIGIQGGENASAEAENGECGDRGK